jgi:hypothetical protein
MIFFVIIKQHFLLWKLKNFVNYYVIHFFSSQTYFLNLLTNFRNLTPCWSVVKENIYTNLKKAEPYEVVYSSGETSVFCLLANSG